MLSMILKLIFLLEKCSHVVRNLNTSGKEGKRFTENSHSLNNAKNINFVLHNFE